MELGHLLAGSSGKVQRARIASFAGGGGREAQGYSINAIGDKENGNNTGNIEQPRGVWGTRLRHVAVVRLEVVQIWSVDHAWGSNILDLVSADICLLARHGLDGAGI